MLARLLSLADFVAELPPADRKFARWYFAGFLAELPPADRWKGGESSVSA